MLNVSDYVIGKIKNRALIMITPNEREILFRVISGDTSYRPQPIVIQVDQNNCWVVLTGSVWKAYPKVKYQGKDYRLSRLTYEEFYGVNPMEKHVLHKCDNPRCINPEHLYLGTDADNARDRMERGRSFWTSKDIKKPKAKKRKSCL